MALCIQHQCIINASPCPHHPTCITPAPLLKVEEYLNELAEVGKMYEEMVEQNLRLTQQITEKEDLNTSLIKEKIKGKQIETLLRGKNEILQRKAAAAEKAKQAAEMLQVKLDLQYRSAVDQTQSLMASEQLVHQLVESHKNSAREALQLFSNARAQLEIKSTLVDEIQVTFIGIWIIHSCIDSVNNSASSPGACLITILLLFSSIHSAVHRLCEFPWRMSRQSLFVVVLLFLFVHHCCAITAPPPCQGRAKSTTEELHEKSSANTKLQEEVTSTAINIISQRRETRCSLGRDEMQIK